MKRRFLFVCLAAFALCGCPRRQEVVPEFYFSDEFKAYTQFEVGSYWIYKDSASEDRDSVYLFKNFHEILAYDETSPGMNTCNHKAVQSEKNSTRTSSHFYNAQFYDVALVECNGSQTYSNDFNTSFFINNRDYTESPTQLGDSIIYIQKTYYLGYRDSLQTQNQTYKHLRTFLLTGDLATFQPRLLCWAKNVGIIRKQMDDGKVWLLEKYKVIQ